MIAVEKERTRPYMNRLLVLRGKVVVEADEKELFDLRVPIRFRRGISHQATVGTKRIRHV